MIAPCRLHLAQDPRNPTNSCRGLRWPCPQQVEATAHPELQIHSTATSRFEVLDTICTVLLVLLASTAAFGQTKNAPSVPSSEPATLVQLQRFEIGAGAALAHKGNDFVDYWFAGGSATYALRPWLALGAEVDAFTVAGLGNEPDRWKSSCPACILNGVQTLALGELRMPLGHDAIQLFGRVAIGPAFVTHADSASSIIAAGRGSVGIDLRVWHVYARPFVLAGALAAGSPQFGFGFETGAVF